MKELIIVFFVGMFVLTSCQKDPNLSEPDYNTESQEWDDSWDDDEGNGSDEGGADGAISLYAVSGQTILLKKDFDVSGELLTYQNDKQKHQEIWEFVTQLIPLQYRDKITEFELFHGQDELLGYVTPIDQNDLSRWRFALAIDQAKGIERIDFGNDFTYTTLHELGHVVTLNDDQVNVGEGQCASYHTGEGCSNQNSYINKIFDIGWKDIIDEHIGADAFEFYEKYKSRFLTEYAATNPGEDIAEVFTYFIIQENKPAGSSIADQKVRAMYGFPKLVKMRTDIRNSIPAARLKTLTLEGYMAVLPMLVKGHKHH